MYFDNFFTSYDTLKKLSDLNVRATGAVRLNRTGSASEFLTSNKELMKLRRNSYDCSCDGKVYIVTWHDNAVVTVASNGKLMADFTHNHASYKLITAEWAILTAAREAAGCLPSYPEKEKVVLAT
ncbi:PiggyBac transposable element-derived protein 3 [Trichinella patagoniensis]|uniref:PiggyBac transposable element-derived protein 3 n=1 Tax=Trichinella patagoniensis TaxID=990121 RepID=A0A0V0Z5I4_9BILA|nr:PiggyBac transposable element-derived protein 3 [Trichinella patagoniensis]